MEPHLSADVYINTMTHNGRAERVRAAYDGNYEHVVELKRKYDPNNLLRMNHNIPPAWWREQIDTTTPPARASRRHSEVAASTDRSERRRAACSTCSWPQAAPISTPREYRTVAGMPASHRTEAKRLITVSPGRSYG